MPGGVDRHLRRALGRRGQQARLRAGPLPCGLQRSRPHGETPGYQGITIPKAQRATVVRGGILEMDEPEHSPTAVR